MNVKCEHFEHFHDTRPKSGFFRRAPPPPPCAQTVKSLGRKTLPNERRQRRALEPTPELEFRGGWRDYCIYCSSLVRPRWEFTREAGFAKFFADILLKFGRDWSARFWHKSCLSTNLPKLVLRHELAQKALQHDFGLNRA